MLLDSIIGVVLTLFLNPCAWQAPNPVLGSSSAAAAASSRTSTRREEKLKATRRELEELKAAQSPAAKAPAAPAPASASSSQVGGWADSFRIRPARPLCQPMEMWR